MNHSRPLFKKIVKEAGTLKFRILQTEREGVLGRDTDKTQPSFDIVLNNKTFKEVVIVIIHIFQNIQVAQVIIFFPCDADQRHYSLVLDPCIRKISF